LQAPAERNNIKARTLKSVSLKGLAMSETYFVENSDPNNFIISHVGADGRYIFHVVKRAIGMTSDGRDLPSGFVGA